jgi:hypothetical protein
MKMNTGARQSMILACGIKERETILWSRKSICKNADVCFAIAIVMRTLITTARTSICGI